MWSKLHLLILVSLPFKSISQTCIVVARTRDAIIVGADTRYGQVFYTKRLEGTIDSTYIKYSITCKINRVKNIYFSIAGYDIETLKHLATVACMKYSRINDAALYFKDSAVAVLKDYLYNLKNKYHKIYSDNFHVYEGAGALFYGYEDGISKIVEVHLKTTNDVNGEIAIQPSIKFSDDVLGQSFVDVNGNYRNYDFVAIGRNEAIDSISKAPGFLKIDFANRIKLCIETEAKYTIEVGLPIDMMIITKTGYAWLINPNGCTFQ